MQIELSEIDYYVKNHEAKKHTWYQPYCQEAAISPTRQEVVLRLRKEIRLYEHFPLWNRDLIEYLLPRYQLLTDEIIMMPVVGSEKYFDAKILQHNNRNYLIVDLLNIADYTTSVNEMCYILHNLCHVNMLRYVLRNTYVMPQSYYEQLEYRFFCEGLAQYLSWNRDVKKYRLNENRYMPRKKVAVHTLKAALRIEGSKIQDQVLQMLDRLELWERFTDTAGMFFCDYCYHEGGTEQLKQYVEAGNKGAVQTMLNTKLGEL